MIKTGIYGLLRVLTFLGPPPAWWGWTLLVVGAVSGVARRALRPRAARPQAPAGLQQRRERRHHLRWARPRAAGHELRHPPLALLGYAGALLHVVNHALFKGLLFLGAGAVLHATGTRDLEQLGGLLKRMPVTGAAFLVGAAAICGLPP